MLTLILSPIFRGFTNLPTPTTTRVYVNLLEGNHPIFPILGLLTACRGWQDSKDAQVGDLGERHEHGVSTSEALGWWQKTHGIHRQKWWISRQL